MLQFQRRSARILLFACALLAFSGTAQAAIVQCIDAKGSITFTDVPCKADADTVHSYGMREASPLVSGNSMQANHFAAAEQARATASTKRRTAKRRFPLDVATLKAARIAMQSIDHASALVRQQATLDQGARSVPWEFWRS